MNKIIVILMMWLTGALAQTPEAAKIADQAVVAWSKGEYNTNPSAVQSYPEMRKYVQSLLRFSPASKDVGVNVKTRDFLARKDNSEVYQYVARMGQEDVELHVQVSNTNSTWQVHAIRASPKGMGLPSWLAHPVAQGLFVIFSIAVVAGAFVKGFWRTWILEALKITWQYRWLALVVNIVLYGAMLLGWTVAYSDKELAVDVQEYIASSLGATGIGQFVMGGVVSATVGIVIWNFSSGAVFTTFLPGMMLGLPALFFNFFRFMVLGVALSPALMPSQAFLLHIPTIIIELQAYIFVTTFALISTVRMFKVGFAQAVREYPYSLAVALFLLVVAGWYEAFELLVLLKGA